MAGKHALRAARSVWLSDIARVGLMTTLVKLAGGFKMIISARILGLSAPLDAYLVAFSITSFVCDSLAGTLPAALVPMFVRHTQPRRRPDLVDCYSPTLYRSLILLSVAGTLVVGFRRPLLLLMAPGFSVRELDLTCNLILILAPMFPVMGINGVWRSLLQAHGRFTVAAIAPIMTPIAATVVLLVSPVEARIYTLAIGSSLGVVGEMFVLGCHLMELRLPIFPHRNTTAFHARWFKRNYVPLVFSSLLHGGVSIVDQSVATLLAAGSVSALALGTRLVSVIMAIGPGTLSTVFLPKISATVAIADWPSMRRMLRRWLLWGCGAATVLASALILVSGPIAHLMLRKASHASTDIHALELVQSLSFLQLPFLMATVLLMRVIISLQLNRRLVSVAVLALAVNAVLDIGLVRLIGIAGIVVSSACVQALIMCVLLHMISKLRVMKAVDSVAA